MGIRLKFVFGLRYLYQAHRSVVYEVIAMFYVRDCSWSIIVYVCNYSEF